MPFNSMAVWGWLKTWPLPTISNAWWWSMPPLGTLTFI